MAEVNVAPDDWEFWQRKMDSVQDYKKLFLAGIGWFVLPFVTYFLLNVYFIDPDGTWEFITFFAMGLAFIGYGAWKYKDYPEYKRRYAEARRAAGLPES